MNFATAKEREVLCQLSEKYMSDEETDNESPGGLIIRKLSWRSDNLNKLLSKIEDRHQSETTNSKPMRPRRIGDESERLPPTTCLPWAIDPSFSFQVADGEDEIDSSGTDPIPSLETSSTDNGNAEVLDSLEDDDSDYSQWISSFSSQ